MINKRYDPIKSRRQLLYITMAFSFFFQSLYAQDPPKTQNKAFHIYQVITLGTQGIYDADHTSNAFEFNYGVWFDFNRLVLDIQLGVTKSVDGYQRSSLLYVNDYIWYESDQLIHVYLNQSTVSFLLGGGIGLKYRNEKGLSEYSEGSFLKIRSYEKKDYQDFVTSFIAQLTLMYHLNDSEDKQVTDRKKSFVLSLAYELLNTGDLLEDLNLISVHFGFIF